MKTNLLVSIGGIWMNILSALGVTHYVDANNANPSPPFLSWNAAATNIQDALDASSVGDEVLVTNGIYRNGGSFAPFDPTTTNRASVNKAVSLRSVNGAALTLIDGLGTNRCVFLSSGALLRGFTLTNGVGYQGAGLFCENTNSPVYDCFLVNNIAQGGGGGGVQGGTLINCVLKSNSNFAGRFSGMGGAGARGSVLNNCAVVGNFSTTNGGGVASSILNNCTVVANSAWSVGGGAWGSTLNNCIIYSNSAVVDSVGNYFSCGIENSCTTPMPASGTGNIVGNPLFLSVESGNLRLQSNSPCINSGKNDYVSGSTDLDGNPRIAGGRVDIGAYEFQNPVSAISYAWLQQYGLLINSSTDSADPDGDGRNNWQEWRCQTIPTNALSVLKMVSATRSGNDVLITWQSVAGVNYFIEHSTNLGAVPPFAPLVANVPGQAGTTSYLDLGTAGASALFYRVGVGN